MTKGTLELNERKGKSRTIQSKHLTTAQFQRCYDTQHNDTQHNDTQHNDTQHNDTQHNDTQHNDAQHNDTHHSETQHTDTQYHGLTTLNKRALSI